MITIGMNNKKIAYGIKHYNLDSEKDLQNLPTKKEKMGSTCFVIDTSKYYMLNSNYEWVEITPFGQVVSSGDSGDNGDSTLPDETTTIVYEGGVI